jgi:hypothetical protein
LLPAAAANNADWCALVCRTHGLETTLAADAWTSSSRTPPYYPDAVTLVPDLAIPDLLARIDNSSGCSIKDSFASLDLTTYGFQVLFEAQWLVRLPRPLPARASADTWSIVKDADSFAKWERAWQRHHEEGDVLRAGLLDVSSVTVLAEWNDDGVVAGAVLNRSSEVVGISNFFADPLDVGASWGACIDFISTLFPEAFLAGYESEPSLIAQRSGAFEAVGPLRVWVSS